MDLSGFNATEYQDIGYDPIPDGTYNVILTETEERVSQTTQEPYLSITYTISEGPYKDQKLFDRIFIRSQNEKSASIAMRILASICLAVGITSPKRSEELVGRPLTVITKVKNGYTNVVRRNPVQWTAPAQQHQQAVYQQPQPSTYQQPQQTGYQQQGYQQQVAPYTSTSSPWGSSPSDPPL